MSAATTTAPAPRGAGAADQPSAVRSSDVRRTGGVRFPLVDSLRAIAALSVFLFHVGGKAFPGAPIGAYTGRLNLGVTIFFVISGFLLYRPFAGARLAEHRSALTPGRYAWHRFLRIVPAYLVALTVIAVWLDIPGVFGSDAIVYYGFGQVYSLRTELGGLSQGWTLSVEVAFYVFLPFWAWAMSHAPARTPRQRLRVEFLALGALAALSLAYKLFFIGGVSGMNAQLEFALANALPRYLDVFAIGMALAVASVWFETHPRPRGLSFLDGYSWLPWVLAGVALWVLATQLGLAPNSFARVSDNEQITVHYLDAAVALGLMLPAVLGDPRRGIVRRVLGSRALIWVGVVSYGLYLWHLAVLTQLGRWGIPQDVVRWTGVDATVVWTVVGLVPALAVAAASWYWIEKPVLRYKRLRLPSWVRRLEGGAHGWSNPLRLVMLGVSTFLVWVVIGTALGPGGPHKARGASLAPGSSWVHIAATYDGQQLRLYEDAQLIASARASGRPGPASAPIEIGNYLTGERWSGPLHYVAFYRTALTPQVIRLRYYIGTRSWSDYVGALTGTPSPISLWQDRLPVSGRPARATPAPSGVFSVESWLKAQGVSNRVVAAQPGAWSLKTSAYGNWIFTMVSGSRRFVATAKVGPPREP